MGNNQKQVVNNQEDMPLIQVPKLKRTFYFWLLYALFMIDFIARIGVNAILPVIQGDLQLSDSEVGLIASTVLLGMSVFVMPVSYLGEKKSTKMAISGSAVVWSIGSIMSGMATNLGVLLASRFLVGAGNAAYAPLSNSMITSMYKKSEWGKKIGVYNTAMTLGGAAGSIIFANLAGSLGWRISFYIIGGISLFLSVLSLMLPNMKVEGTEAEKDKGKDKVNLKDAGKMVLKNKALVMMCFSSGIGLLGLQAIGAWMSVYFVRVMEMPLETAGMLIGLSGILGVIGFPIGGAILDKWYKKDKRSRAWMPAICYALCALCYSSGFIFESVPLIVTGQVVYCFGGTSFHLATQELVPVWFKSTSYGVLVVFNQFLGAMGPLLAGIISDAIGLVNALLVVQGFFLITVCMLLFTSSFYVKYFNQARELEKEAGMLG